MSLEQKVGEVMQKEVHTIDLNSTVTNAAKVMVEKGVGAVVIVQGRIAVGIITERDIVRRVINEGLDPSKVLVRDVMSTPLVTISPEANLLDACRLMTEYEIRRIVVTNSEGFLAGIISSSDMARVLAEEKEYQDEALNAIARVGKTPTGGPYQ